MSEVIFPSLPDQSKVPFLQRPFFTQMITTDSQNFSDLTRSKQKVSNQIQRKFQFEVALWRQFFVLAQPMRYSFPLLRWSIFNQMIAPGNQIFKSHQIGTKTSNYIQKPFKKILVRSCYMTSFFCCYSTDLAFFGL